MNFLKRTWNKIVSYETTCEGVTGPYLHGKGKGTVPRGSLTIVPPKSDMTSVVVNVVSTGFMGDKKIIKGYKVVVPVSRVAADSSVLGSFAGQHNAVYIAFRNHNIKHKPVNQFLEIVR